MRARSEGSWADGLRVATALEASTLALVAGDGARFTFAVSRPGQLAPGDLVRLRSDRTSSCSRSRRSSRRRPPRRCRATAARSWTVTARPGSVIRLLREPPAAGSAGQATYVDDAGRPHAAAATVAGSARDRLTIELAGAPAPAEGAWLRLDLGAERVWASVTDVRGAEGVASPAQRGLRVTGALVRPAALGAARSDPSTSRSG